MQISAGVRLRHATFAGLPYDDESIYVRNPQTDSCCGFNCWVLPESIMYYFFICLPHGRFCPVGILGTLGAYGRWGQMGRLGDPHGPLGDPSDFRMVWHWVSTWASSTMLGASRIQFASHLKSTRARRAKFPTGPTIKVCIVRRLGTQLTIKNDVYK